MSDRRLVEAWRSRSARSRLSCVNCAHVSGVEALRAGGARPGQGGGPGPHLTKSPYSLPPRFSELISGVLLPSAVRHLPAMRGNTGPSRPRPVG